MSKVQTRAGAAAAARLAYFLGRLSLDLVGIARGARGGVTPDREKFPKSSGNLPPLLILPDPFFSARRHSATMLLRLLEIDAEHSNSCNIVASFHQFVGPLSKKLNQVVEIYQTLSSR